MMRVFRLRSSRTLLFATVLALSAATAYASESCGFGAPASHNCTPGIGGGQQCCITICVNRVGMSQAAVSGAATTEVNRENPSVPPSTAPVVHDPDDQAYEDTGTGLWYKHDCWTVCEWLNPGQTLTLTVSFPDPCDITKTASTSHTAP